MGDLTKRSKHAPSLREGLREGLFIKRRRFARLVPRDAEASSSHMPPSRGPLPRCAHGKRPAFCAECDGRKLCRPPCPRAGRLKAMCAACDGSGLCRAPCPTAGQGEARKCQRCLAAAVPGVCVQCRGPCSKLQLRCRACHQRVSITYCKPPCERAGKLRCLCPREACGGGSALCRAPCPHAGRPKAACPYACGGGALCQPPCIRAGRLRAHCGLCMPSSVCAPPCPRAGRLALYCLACGGSGLCRPPCVNAGKLRARCPGACERGSALCHPPCVRAGKVRQHCPLCSRV